MIKLRHLVLIALASVFMYACGDDINNRFVDNFDHAAQAVVDQDTLVKYFKNHYYDAALDTIKPIESGKTSLFDDSNLKVQDITENEIDYKLYHYIIREGNPNPSKDFPTVMDSVLVTYTGLTIENSLNQSRTFEVQNSATWFTLDAVIGGWRHGFTNFKGGENITNNGPITYQNGGKGILFIPSGLAYRNQGSGAIPANTPLLFYINLLDHVEGTDHDNDGLASILEIEDASEQPDPRRVNTDSDQLPNYRDNDDDGDGTLTKDEDANGDGDPRNDFSDSSNPTLPDYLNPRIK